MRILWISSLAWNDNGKYKYPVNGVGAISGSLFQESIIKGLEEQGHTVDIICDYPYSPEIKKNLPYKWSHRKNGNDYTIRHTSTPYISLLTKSRLLASIVKVYCKKESYDFAIAYLIHEPYMRALLTAKKENPQLETVLICPDLPDLMDMSLHSKPLKQILKKIDMIRIMNLYKVMDGFVLFAKHMKHRIPIDSKPYTVIEGVASIESLDLTPVKKEKYIIYAGSLQENFGIRELIDSLKYIKDNDVKILIFGTGAMSDYVKRVAAKNHRIEYRGFVQREKLFEYQKKSIAIVNARSAKDEFTKYSFPSKSFENLYSGTPVITSWLKGYPDEYRNYFFVIEDNSAKSIGVMINQIMNMSSYQLEKHKELTRSFIRNQKNYIVQSRKLLDFLKSIGD